MRRSFELLSAAPPTQGVSIEETTSPQSSHIDMRAKPRFRAVEVSPLSPDGGLPTAIRDQVPAAEPPRRYVQLAAPTSHLLVLQKWEGTVTARNGNGFTAILHDHTDPTRPDERIDLPFDEVPEGDRALIEMGAIFYWCIGYRDHADGQRERVSLIRFQRLPSWTPRELKAAREAAHKLADELDWH